jgi:hypothetical protein
VEGSLTLTWTNSDQTSPFDTTIESGGTVRDTTFDKTISNSTNVATGQMSNSMSFRKFGLAFSPQHSIKYETQKQSSGTTNRKLESAALLGSELFDHALLGNLKIRLQHSYLKTMTPNGFNSTNRVNAGFTVSRRLTQDLLLRFGASAMNTAYGGESQPDGSSKKVKVEKPSEAQSSYSVGARFSLFSAAHFDSRYRVTSQTTSSSASFSLSSKLVFPVLNAVLDSELATETRETENQLPQTRINIENSLSLSIRRIVLFFKYDYSKEERFGETFTYSLFSGEITRSF